MSELTLFQDQFILALGGEEAKLPFSAAPGFNVYRNTIAKGRIDVLAARYPTVERLVGGAWFADCARLFAEQQPPSDPVLAVYGAGFPSFLAGFPPARELPYLGDVARIDDLWMEAHLAVDAPALGPEDLAGLGAEDIFSLAPGLHPAARTAWFDTPAVSIWERDRPGSPPLDDDIAWGAEGVLIARPLDSVGVLKLDAPGKAFVDACAQGRALGHAAQAALTLDHLADVAGLFAGILALGALAAINPT